MMVFKCLVFKEIIFFRGHDFSKRGLQSYLSYQLHEKSIKMCVNVDFLYYGDYIIK